MEEYSEAKIHKSTVARLRTMRNSNVNTDYSIYMYMYQQNQEFVYDKPQIHVSQHTGANC